MDGLKSKLTNIQTDMQDRQWRKVILDFQELVTALKRDTVSELIGNVLRKEYGEWNVFSYLVFEIKRTAMLCVADALENGLPYKGGRLAVVFHHDFYEKLEISMKYPVKEFPGTNYWTGENPSAS